MGSSRLLEALSALEAWGSKRDWLGPDPYEGLNARRLRVLARTRLGRRLLIQLVKRSPVDLRSVLGIPPEHNSAGVAHIVSGYARAAFLPEAERREKLAHWVGVLEGLAIRTEPDACWGYHFDVETRVVFYPRTMPNTVATAFAAQALLDAHDAAGGQRPLDLAEAAGDFFLRHVPQTSQDGGAYFGYFVDDRSPIHNSNMLVCGLLARLYGATGREDFRAAAAEGVGWTLARQRPDGSWPYGELPHIQWVDGFHTGYVLDDLMRCAKADVHPGIEAALERGLDFYRRHLFLEDGTPKYYANGIYPIDGQCVAQAIQTFSLAAARDPAYEEQAWRVLDFGLRRMRRDDGAFMFQRRRFWRNPAPHVRWVEAPMFHALTHLGAR